MSGKFYATKERPDRAWDEYPIGTVATAHDGSGWLKTERGWRAGGGAYFPTPGASAAWVQEPAGVSKKTRLSIGDRVTENDSPAQRVWTVTDISDGKAQLETPDFTTRIRVTRVFCTGKQRRSGWSKVMEVESDV